MKCKKHQNQYPCKTCLMDSLQFYEYDNEIRRKEGRTDFHDVQSVREKIATLR